MSRRRGVMREFQCPRCGAMQRAVAKEVSHRCPANKNTPTAFVVVEEEK